MVIFANVTIATMKCVEFVPFLLTEVADIFSIRIDGDKISEVEKFFILFKDSTDPFLKDDLTRIINGLSQIANNGALERFFRNEGIMVDRVVAIPLYIRSRDHSKHGTLRLYCIRVSDKLLIVGGGGLKTTRTPEEDPVLSFHVKTLQSIDKRLEELENGINLNDTLFNLTIEID